MIKHYTIYGEEEVKIVLVHGGPGANDSLNDLANMLSGDFGVLEINQTKLTISELISEMNEIIHATCNRKVILLGHSWGAWLVCLFAERYPDMIHRLILVGSGPFDKKYAKEYHEARLKRLNKEEIKLFNSLSRLLKSKSTIDKDKVMNEFGKLMMKVDSFALDDNINDTSSANYNMFKSIWAEAVILRNEGKLIKSVKEINIPIHIIHGDYDSHEKEGILNPFIKNHINFNFNIIPNCGHYPWKERHAKSHFLNIIANEINKIL